MSDKEVLIKIPEEIYNWVNDVNKFSNDYEIGDFIDLIKNGVQLPKGHGRLFDEKDIVDKNYEIIGSKIYELEPIVEADNNKTLYKKGDIILNKQGNLVFVIKDIGEYIIVTINKSGLENKDMYYSYPISYEEVSKKIGNIYDE